MSQPHTESSQFKLFAQRRFLPFFGAQALGAFNDSRTVFLSILGISWFWFYGALLLAQLPLYSKEVLGGSEQVVTLLLVLFSMGVGFGSLLCV